MFAEKKYFTYARTCHRGQKNLTPKISYRGKTLDKTNASKGGDP